VTSVRCGCGRVKLVKRDFEHRVDGGILNRFCGYQMHENSQPLGYIIKRGTIEAVQTFVSYP